MHGGIIPIELSSVFLSATCCLLVDGLDIPADSFGAAVRGIDWVLAERIFLGPIILKPVSGIGNVPGLYLKVGELIGSHLLMSFPIHWLSL